MYTLLTGLYKETVPLAKEVVKWVLAAFTSNGHDWISLDRNGQRLRHIGFGAYSNDCWYNPYDLQECSKCGRKSYVENFIRREYFRAGLALIPSCKDSLVQSILDE